MDMQTLSSLNFLAFISELSAPLLSLLLPQVQFRLFQSSKVIQALNDQQQTQRQVRTSSISETYTSHKSNNASKNEIFWDHSRYLKDFCFSE